MAHDVFISHSSKDKAIADAACACLESNGIRCWVAPRDIRPGAEWGESIIKAIRASRVMVVIFSSHANASKQIMREVERAVNAGVTLIPMRIEEILPEGNLDYFLSAAHWLDAFTPPLEQHLDQLAAAIHEILKLSAPPIAPGEPAAAEPEFPPIAAPLSGSLRGSPRSPSAGIADSRVTPTSQLEAEPSPPPQPEPTPSQPSRKSLALPMAITLLLLAAAAALGWYFGIEKPAEDEKLRQAELAQQAAIDKEKELETQQAADAAAAAKAKADADADAKALADAKTKADGEEAARLKAEADKKAADDAAAEQSARDKAAQAAAAQMAQLAAAQKAKDDAAAAAAAQAAKYPQSGQPWTNKLGMKFVPAGTPGILVSVWDTRVQDYQAFVDATGHVWPKPDFVQAPDHPAVEISWDDAEAFCRWLTDKDHQDSSINANESYRLPTDKEWSDAVVTGEVTEFPWGNQWPPSQGAGNYSGEGDGLKHWIPGYHDGYSRTSPVGTFRPNSSGLYDMGGNVWQWCEDWYRKDMNDADIFAAYPDLLDDGGGHRFHVLRGASWGDCGPQDLRIVCRDNEKPETRSAKFGFRCVLVVTP